MQYLKYGTNAFVASAIASWNFFQKEFPNSNMRQISYSQLKVLIKNFFFNSYNQILFKNIGCSFVSDYFMKLRKSRRFYF